jgi:hypothetical protein
VTRALQPRPYRERSGAYGKEYLLQGRLSREINEDSPLISNEMKSAEYFELPPSELLNRTRADVPRP